jgi:hypothetical protein
LRLRDGRACAFLDHLGDEAVPNLRVAPDVVLRKDVSHVLALVSLLHEHELTYLEQTLQVVQVLALEAVNLFEKGEAEPAEALKACRVGNLMRPRDIVEKGSQSSSDFRQLD